MGKRHRLLMDGAIISVLLMAGTLLYLALPKAPPLGLGASVAGGQRESEEERTHHLDRDLRHDTSFLGQGR